MTKSRTLIIALTVAAGALIAAGCGSDEESSGASAEAGTTATAPAAKQGSDAKLPKPLAANREEANEILEEGSLDPKLAELQGFPVVVNQWGSWCPPCRAEFPYFQQAAEKYADEVAFVGIDMQDSREAAEAFLDELPVPYPSVFDPNAAQIASLGGGVVSPTTVFIDERGEVVDLFQGEYVSLEQLETDIEKFLLS